MTTKTIIYAEHLNDAQRVSVPAKLFGAAGFALKVEPLIFSMARMLSDDYQGGYWEMYSLSNGGFFMAPISDPALATTSPNGYAGTMSAEAFGIAVGLFTYSHLSFGDDPLAAACDLPPISRTTVNEKSPSTQENDGHEEVQVQRRTNHCLFFALCGALIGR